jgi:hypothetical protein
VSRRNLCGDGLVDCEHEQSDDGRFDDHVIYGFDFKQLRTESLFHVTVARCHPANTVEAPPLNAQSNNAAAQAKNGGSPLVGLLDMTALLEL